MASTKNTSIITTTPIKAEGSQWATELMDTGYITKEDLLAKLEEAFASDGYKPEDFKIMTRNERWTYHAPRELSYDDNEKKLKSFDGEIQGLTEQELRIGMSRSVLGQDEDFESHAGDVLQEAFLIGRQALFPEFCCKPQ